MKKIISYLLMLTLLVTVFAGCTPKEEAPTETPTGTETPAETETPATSADGAIAKLGLGQITTIGKSRDLGKDADGKEILPLGQVDTIMVAAGFDKDGKVVSVTIDNAQTKVDFDAALQVTSDLAAEGKTKVELGADYGMIKGSAIGKEWFEQIAELEKWMVGKTIEEVVGMKTVEKDASHPAVPDEAELTSLVTVSVEGYLAALEEAYNNAVDAPGASTVGLGHNVSIGKSKGLGKDADGKEILPLAQVDTVMSATAFDADGKVVKTIIDNAQTKINFDNAGKVTTDKAAEFKTKQELKEDYGMIKGSAIGKEWYEQANALADWMAGKTIEEIKAMKTVEKDAAHPAVPDEAELTSLVTVSVEGYVAAVEESFNKAK